MRPELPDAARRVVADAEARGVKIEVVETEGARSAEDAAKAVGTMPARIVKSLVFRGLESGTPLLLLVSGIHRVDVAVMQAFIGEALKQADAEFVRTASGFAIGGVSPFGWPAPPVTLMDESLFDHPTVWAAAGTPRHVFEVVPLQLRSALGARVASFA